MNFEMTRSRVALLLYARDVASLLPLYSDIRVARALSGAGPYEDVSARVAEKAAITGANRGPFRLNGTVLALLLPDKTILSYQFATANPVDAQDAAAELNLASPLLDCDVDAERLVVRTSDAGTDAGIGIDGGDACSFLGLERNVTAFGKNIDIPLIDGQVLYSFCDDNGSIDYTYRYRFHEPSIPGESSPLFTVPSLDVTIDLDLLAVGHARVIGLDGHAAAGAIAQIANRWEPPSVSGRLSIGSLSRLVDRNGEVWFPLVKGAKVELWIAGTPVHRIIEVPNANEFDMLDPSLVHDDPWGIVAPPYTALPRTTP